MKSKTIVIIYTILFVIFLSLAIYYGENDRIGYSTGCLGIALADIILGIVYAILKDMIK